MSVDGVGVTQLPGVDQLIEQLQLQAHPEGGYFRERHRSDVLVRRPDGVERSAGTLIDFLLPRGVVSAWHRVSHADEIWHFSAGSPLLLQRQAPSGAVEDLELGAFPMATWHRVPPGWWQSARSLGEWSLVQCTVSPGFSFEDFELRC